MKGEGQERGQWEGYKYQRQGVGLREGRRAPPTRAGPSRGSWKEMGAGTEERYPGWKEDACEEEFVRCRHQRVGEVREREGGDPQWFFFLLSHSMPGNYLSDLKIRHFQVQNTKGSILTSGC